MSLQLVSTGLIGTLNEMEQFKNEHIYWNERCSLNVLRMLPKNLSRYPKPSFSNYTCFVQGKLDLIHLIRQTPILKS